MSRSSSTFPGLLAVIPARFGSTRFPGKPLVLLGGKPMIWHVYQQCLKADHITQTVVATDDTRIMDECARWSIPAVITGDHSTGTDRVAECAQQQAFSAYDGYVNVQGDEPFISPESIDRVASALHSLNGNTVAVVNAYSGLQDPSTVRDHNVVKVTLRVNGSAMAFSRQPIPYPHAATHPTYFRQLGLYAFTPAGLRDFATTTPGPIERAEGVEMLRFLEHGREVQMVKVDDNGIAIDTPQDLARAQSLLAQHQHDHS
ncbi:3-deoxy-manno-octulosonate cytidylyltransferase [Actinophytocola sp.]|uniref:3-deoxy-manno-octulosonate cytidylyltransferase n=1 Tax=Actinophytocola sp. TaxID=1872138 RepID=UPI003899C38F